MKATAGAGALVSSLGTGFVVALDGAGADEVPLFGGIPMGATIWFIDGSPFVCSNLGRLVDRMNSGDPLDSGAASTATLSNEVDELER